MTAVRTPQFGPVLSLVDNPDALELIAEDLMVVHGQLPGVLGPTDAAQPFVVLWERKVGQTPRLLGQERIYRCANPIAARGPRSRESGRRRRPGASGQMDECLQCRGSVHQG
jgi:hypothetical protein